MLFHFISLLPLSNLLLGLDKTILPVKAIIFIGQSLSPRSAVSQASR